MKGTDIGLIDWLSANELGTHRNYMVIDLGINNSGIHTVQELLRQSFKLIQKSRRRCFCN